MLDLVKFLLDLTVSPHAITGLLIIILIAACWGFVYAVQKFDGIHKNFVDYIKENNELMSEQLEVCEKRCRENSDQFFRTINMLVNKLDQ